jgi:hypothetical protein
MDEMPFSQDLFEDVNGITKRFGFDCPSAKKPRPRPIASSAGGAASTTVNEQVV